MRRTWTRRSFLRASGVALALPHLESLAGAEPTHSNPRGMVLICNSLGFHAPFFFPTSPTESIDSAPYLSALTALQGRFSVFSGLSHPGVDGGHSSEASFLTAARHPGATTFKNAISLDQFAAKRIGTQTRFANLNLTTGTNGLSWSPNGVAIPPESRPSRLYAKLFLTGTRAEKQRQIQSLEDRRSILDVVLGQATRMQGNLGKRDAEKLDEYFSSVRQVESNLLQARAWGDKPKPAVGEGPPRDIGDRADVIGRTRLMYDLIRLALQTDSTRVVTLFASGLSSVPRVKGVTVDWHNLSHHGKDPAKISQLRLVEAAQMDALGSFLTQLAGVEEGGTNLLDKNLVLFGSNLGNANSHNTQNLPILLAGGGGRHRGYVAFDGQNNTPLCNLFLSILQSVGIEADAFGSSTGTLDALGQA